MGFYSNDKIKKYFYKNDLQSNKGFVYLPSVLNKPDITKITISDFKNIRKCQKERFSHQKEREEINMVSEKEWLLLTVERC
jgi:hypothetical protein